MVSEVVPLIGPLQVKLFAPSKLPPPVPSLIPRLGVKVTLATDERRLPLFNCTWSETGPPRGTIPSRVSPANEALPPLMIHLPVNVPCVNPNAASAEPVLVIVPVGEPSNGTLTFKTPAAVLASIASVPLLNVKAEVEETVGVPARRVI